LNKVISNRADEFLIYAGEAQIELQKRKPDRVFGLLQTNRFGRILKRLIQNVQETADDRVEITPFKHGKEPLLLPFLITEAKTERGDSFEASERQAAFPIWALLKLQQELQKAAKLTLREQGGPLVWFFSNRGEQWQLYGCYTTPEDNAMPISYVR